MPQVELRNPVANGAQYVRQLTFAGVVSCYYAFGENGSPDTNTNTMEYQMKKHVKKTAIAEMQSTDELSLNELGEVAGGDARPQHLTLSSLQDDFITMMAAAKAAGEYK
jgi:hypothetical protein